MEKKSASQKLRVPTALVTERRRAAAQRRGVEKKWVGVSAALRLLSA